MSRTLTTWDAFRELDELSNRLANAFGRSPRRENDPTNFSSSVWAPLVDIFEDEKEYLLSVELPGIDKKDVKVAVERGVLTISGERQSTHEEKKGGVSHRIERFYGAFRRSFVVPEDADSAKIVAEYKNGVLHLHLPKTPETQPKQIEIKVS